MFATELAPGKILQNRYRIIKTLGKGGMGCVYQAHDTHFAARLCALKQTFYSNDTLRKGFEREANLLSQLRHPALPTVHDHFTEDAGQYLVMEFIPGPDLYEILTQRHGAFPHNVIFDWGDQLLQVLNYLHTRNPPIIHRDIKPNNMKVSEDNRIILLDFGLAKDMVGGTVVAGSSRFFSPIEQRLHLETDARSDLYALGATLYSFATGKLPPDALDTRHAAIQNGLPDPLKPIRELNSKIPEVLATVIHKAMALDKNDRPASAADMLGMLNYEGQETIIDGNKNPRTQKTQAEKNKKNTANKISTSKMRKEVRNRAFVLLTGAALIGAIFSAIISGLFGALLREHINNLFASIGVATTCGAISAVCIVVVMDNLETKRHSTGALVGCLLGGFCSLVVSFFMLGLVKILKAESVFSPDYSFFEVVVSCLLCGIGIGVLTVELRHSIDTPKWYGYGHRPSSLRWLLGKIFGG